MKIFFAVIIISLVSLVAVGQNDSVAADFEKNKAKYKLEKFAEGEDASSGYDYLFYKNKESIVKLRVIWSSLANPNYWIEDYYFNDGKLFAFTKYDLAKKNYKNARLGKTIPLKESERLNLTDAKLTIWFEKGKVVTKDDARWNEREREILENAKNNLDLYQDFKADK